MRTFRPRHLGAFLLKAWVALSPSAASAHAIVLLATPAVDAVVHGSNIEVVLRFNGRLDRDRSRLTLLRASGLSAVLALKDTDRPDTLAATIVGLDAGSYRLRWQVLAVDGHITRGDIPFTVAP